MNPVDVAGSIGPIRGPSAGRQVADRAHRSHEGRPGGSLRDERRRRGPERFDARGHVRQRVELANEANDFFFRAVLGAGQHLGEILLVEVRAEQQESGEVELTALHRRKQSRKAPDETGRGNAAEGLVLG